jgi:5-methylthioribose kinase
VVDEVTVMPLSGGVSGEVFEAHAEGREYVVKRARARLDVAETWLADPSRVITEARALEAAGSLTPGAVPEVLDLDAEQATLVIARAPSAWGDWRTTLLEGQKGGDLATWLGEVLATWHRESARAPDILDRFASQDGFEELRLTPFHGAIANAHRDLAGPISTAIERLRGERRCLVHGDFSPKNVLHGQGGAWVIDWEVAHCGAPIFDLAFMLSHLTLKAIHRPGDREIYQGAAADFLVRYEASGGLVAADDPELGIHIGCLLLARVDGKSQASYLTSDQRELTREAAVGLIRGDRRFDSLLVDLEGLR